MKRLILGVAAALVLSTGPAAADGLPDRGKVRGIDVPTPAWSGIYLGAGIGGGAQDVRVESVDDVGGEGVFGTVTLGYDRALGSRWVAGVFGDFDFSDISGDAGGLSFDHNYSWSVGGRLGVLVSPATLLYGTAGYTQAELELSDGIVSLSDTFDGYFVGAGMETFLRDNWTLKLEYRYSDFGDSEVGGLDIDPSLHTARVVLSYRFGPRY